MRVEVLYLLFVLPLEKQCAWRDMNISSPRLARVVLIPRRTYVVLLARRTYADVGPRLTYAVHDPRRAYAVVVAK